MSEVPMIERVANALVNGTLSKLGAEDQAYWRGRARVAVDTMREPTDGQRTRYYELSFNTEVFSDAAWERAIDAALAGGRE